MTMTLKEAVLFLLPLAERDAESLVDAYRHVASGDEGKRLAREQLAKVRAIRKQVGAKRSPI